MRVLAIDTALGACAAAVLDSASGTLLVHESLAMTRGHAEALMPLVARLMQRCALRFAALDRLAVTTGPGSFTGLRVGLAAARGLALAAGKSAVGVSTLCAYAAPHLADDASLPVVAAIDARHGQVYLQLFGRASGRCAARAPRLAPLAEAVDAARMAPARLVGSAAPAIAVHLTGAATPLCVDARAAPDIAFVARLGAARSPGESPPQPLYLRGADAQPQHGANLPRR